MKVGGCVWKFGDNIDTDVMAPGKYLTLDIKQIAQHTLEAVDPRFAREVKPGDIVLGGRNFGCGSSREHAPRVLKILGVSAVLATSFARIFYRNCAAIGLPMLTVPGLWSETEAGDRIDADLSSGVVVNGRSGNAYQANPIPERLLAVIMEGGIGPALRRIAAEHRAAGRSARR